MLSLFSKGYKSYKAIVLLWKNGFAEDASALARTLFELMLQASWVSRDPTRRGRLCLVHESVAQYLPYQRPKTSGDDPDLVRNIENRGEQFTQLRGRSDEFKSNYAKGKKGKTFHEHWWCGSIHDLARWLGPDYLKQHARLYWTLSGYVHSDAHSFKSFFIEDPAGWVVKCRPSEAGDLLAYTPGLATAWMLDLTIMLDMVFVAELHEYLRNKRDEFERLTDPGSTRAPC